MAQHTSAPIRLDFSATPQALAAIAAMGRTEDIRFSPDRRRLAVAAMARQRIFVFAIEVLAGKRIHLSDAVELSSPHLQAPHGLDFLDDDSLAVANRDGELCLFRLPPCGSQAQGELPLLRSFPNDTRELLGPGSVAASQCADGQHELLVCRNFGQRLSRHVVAAAQGYAPSAENLLPGDWLATPNGISISASRRWRAVSNLHDQCALLYAHESADDQPQAVLRGASHPHGIRIADDDRYLLLADAGGPYVHIYHQADGLWRGIYDPALSLRVMDEPLFQSRHAFPPNKGGPKGLDLDTAAGLLVTTSLTQPLAFFDLDQVLARVPHQGPRSFAGSVPEQDVRYQLERQRRHARVEREAWQHERLASAAEHRAAEAAAHAAQVEARLAEMSASAGHFQARTQALLDSSSWRITAPLRRLLGRRNAPRPYAHIQTPPANCIFSVLNRSATMQLDIVAPQQVLDAIAAIGRTEDLRFSPDRRRLAVVAIRCAQIFVFDIEVRSSPAGKQVHLDAVVVLSSEHLLAPHGLDFVDNDTLAVANREGELCLFRLLPRDGSNEGKLSLLQSFPTTDRELLGPGSVAASRCDDGRHELLVCRNFGHRISRHVLDAANGYALNEERVLLGKWLEIPDGISLDPARRWLAVSSHNTQSVLLYPYAETLHAESDPQAVLRGACYPHGLRFSDDGRYLLLADAGAPYVHIYHQPDGRWQGVYDPSLSLRVMDDALFQSGNENPQEGGPKGIDIDCRTGILATSCQTQALAFFDLDQTLAGVERSGPLALLDGSASAPAAVVEVRHELEKQRRHAQMVTNAIFREHQAAQAEARAAEAQARAHQAEAQLAEMAARAGYFEARTQALLASSSWRITAPLRRVLGWRRRQG